jgi:uncharacterized protein
VSAFLLGTSLLVSRGGGHFLSGSVRPTLEVTIRETVAHLRRKKRADVGIALIDM